MIHELPVGRSVEWHTPPSLFRILGCTFDLDPAAAPGQDWVPAAECIAPPRDGAGEPWHGRVWLNPPYGPESVRFVRRMLEHRHGMMLLPARTETLLFQRAAGSADAVCFLRERLWFTRSDGKRGRASFGSVLLAYGDDCAQIVWASSLGWTVMGR